MAEGDAQRAGTCSRGPNGCGCWYRGEIAGDSREGSQQAALETEHHGGGVASILHLPSPRAFVSHALPAIVESAIGPGVLFYIVLVLGGFKGALIAALVWSYLAAARRWVRHERIPASLWLSGVLLTARTVVSYATGSAFLYFVQPTATTFLVAIVFLVTALARRPFIERLAHDFCPIDPELFKRPFLRRFFLRISLLWAIVLFVNSGTVLYFLLASSVQGFVLERAAISLGLNAVGIAISAALFLRAMRGAGITVRWSGSMPAGPVGGVGDATPAPELVAAVVPATEEVSG